MHSILLLNVNLGTSSPNINITNGSIWEISSSSSAKLIPNKLLLNKFLILESTKTCILDTHDIIHAISKTHPPWLDQRLPSPFGTFLLLHLMISIQLVQPHAGRSLLKFGITLILVGGVPKDTGEGTDAVATATFGNGDIIIMILRDEFEVNLIII